MIFLISSPTSMFIPTLSVYILGIVRFCYLELSCLMLLDNSHDPLLSIKFILSLSIRLDALPVSVVYILYHTLYLWFKFNMCILSRQLLSSHTTFMLLVPVVLSV